MMPSAIKENFKNKSLSVKLERLPNHVLKKYNINLGKIRRKSLRILNHDYAAILETCDLKTQVKTCYVKQNIKSPVNIHSSLIDTKPNEKVKQKAKSTYFQKFSIVDPKKSEYVVEDIRSVFISNGILRFEVKWLHWGEGFNTIEPLRNLKCPNVLKSFVEANTAKYQSEIDDLIKELAVGPMFEEDVLKQMIPLHDIEHNDIELQSYLLALIDIPKSKHSVNVLNKVYPLLQKRIFLEKRETQLRALLEWETKMNEVDYKGKLRVLNNVDFEGPPKHFTYIDKNIPVNVTVSNDPQLGCSCEPCTYKSNCCGKMHDSEYAYSFERRLKHTGVYLFECNKKCKCGPECTNRVVQKGRTNKLCIFKTSNGCGWGVKTDRHIRAGEFVCEYMGEILKFDEAEQRGFLYDKMGVTYLFDLDHIVKTSEAYTIDAYRYGNISHFINHSCDPNLCVVNVWIDCLDPNLSRLALFALEDIEKGQELTIDYKFSTSIPIEENVITANDTFSKESSKVDLGTSNCEPTESAHTPSSKYMICKCGSSNCRKILYYC